MTETQTMAPPQAEDEIDLTAVMPKTEIKSHQF